MNPQIVAVDQHHEVLPAWAECRRRCGAALEVVTLDFHTDVLCCHRRMVFPEFGISAECAENAANILHHDEHFDWALRSGVISRAVIVSLSECAVLPEHPALEVRRSRDLPDIEVMLNDPEAFRTQASLVLDDRFLKPLLNDYPQQRYILDIDCDFIMCKAALSPAEHRLIDHLAQHAELITLSREDDWVRVLKLPGEDISGTEIAENLCSRWKR